MRARLRWHRAERAHPVEDGASVAAFVAFRCSRTLLESMRRAGFDLEAPAARFALLEEALAFALQCACREAWPRLDDGARMRFAVTVAHHAARHLAENAPPPDAARTPAQVESDFIGHLNRRFAEYADLGYGPGGPDFAFLRYFASLVADIVPAGEARWVHDQVIAVEAPAVARTLAPAVARMLAAP